MAGNHPHKLMSRKSLKTIQAGFVIAAMVFSLALAAAPVRAQSGDYRFPGEFEPQESIWMGWPTYRNTVEYPSEPVVVEMIKALVPHVKINLLVNSRAKKNQAKQMLRDNGVPLDQVQFHIISYTDIWFRDMGPIFIVNREGTKKIVDFQFDFWGLPYTSDPESIATDDQVDANVAAEEGLQTVPTEVISEGGDREFNGRGTMLAIEQTELRSNPEFTREMLEEEYYQLFGVTKVIWLAEGVVEDNPPNVGLVPGPDGKLNAYTGGVRHVDEVARFADPHTILLAEVSPWEAWRDPIAAENRRRLETSYQILRNATDQDGKPFTIIRVPAAESSYYTLDRHDEMYQWIATMEFDDGSVFPYPHPVNYLVPAGYMNFVISNGVVLVPKYWQPGLPARIWLKDARVKAVLTAVFPDREIVQIDPLAINMGGGGMHCITQPEPR